MDLNVQFRGKKCHPLDIAVDEFTSLFPIYLSPDSSLEEGMKVMVENDFRHLPIVENGKAVGVVTDRDLRCIQDLELAKKYCLGDIMTKNPFTVTSGESLETVAFEMSRRKIGSVIVNDAKGKVLGIFTATDGLNALVELLRGDVDA